MHSSTRYLLDDYWTLLSDCAWRYYQADESWRPALMDARRANASVEKEVSPYG